MIARKSLTLLVLWLATVVALVAAYLSFTIKRIECQLEGQVCPSEIAAVFDPVIGQSVFFFDSQRLNLALQANGAYQVKEYQLQLPYTLAIQVAPQTLAYVIQPETQTSSWAVTTEGHLLSLATETSHTPVLLNSATWTELDQTQTLPPQLHTLFTNTLADLQAVNIAVSAIYLLDEQTLVVYLPDQLVVIIDPQQTTASITRLKLVLAELAINPATAQVQEIDVRYKLPVLRSSSSIPRHTSY